MKQITKPLLVFSVAAIVFTFLFRYFLSVGIKNGNNLIFIVPVFYFVIMFLAGWFFGKKDKEIFPVIDIGFRFHLSTYIIHTIVSIVWVMFIWKSSKENTNILSNTIIFWGAIVLLHYIFYWIYLKRSKKRIFKEDFFD